MPASDEQLLARIREHDSEAFDELFRRYHDALYGHVLRIVRDADLARDVVQEALLRVWTRADTWQSSGSCRSWLFRIAANVALNQIRASHRRREAPLPEGLTGDPASEDEGLAADPEPGPDARAVRAEERAVLDRLIEALPADKREVVRLSLASDNDLESVSSALSIPRGTVKSRLYYARKLMSDEWKEMAPEWDDP